MEPVHYCRPAPLNFKISGRHRTWSPWNQALSLYHCNYTTPSSSSAVHILRLKKCWVDEVKQMEIHVPIIILAWQLGQSPLFFLDFQLLWDCKTSSELIPTKARNEPRTHTMQTTCCRISSWEPRDQTFIWQTYKLTKPTDHFAGKQLSTYSPEEKNL